MKDTSRRPMPSETAQVNEDIPTFMQELKNLVSDRD